MSRSDRVRLYRAQIVVEARRMVEAKPGEYPKLEALLRGLYDAHRALADERHDDDTPTGPRAA